MHWRCNTTFVARTVDACTEYSCLAQCLKYSRRTARFVKRLLLVVIQPSLRSPATCERHPNMNNASETRPALAPAALWSLFSRDNGRDRGRGFGLHGSRHGGGGASAAGTTAASGGLRSRRGAPETQKPATNVRIPTATANDEIYEKSNNKNLPLLFFPEVWVLPPKVPGASASPWRPKGGQERPKTLTPFIFERRRCLPVSPHPPRAPSYLALPPSRPTSSSSPASAE